MKAVLDGVDGVEGLVARLLDGGGLRPREALRLRVTARDGEKRLVTLRSGKSDKDRNTLLPHSLLEPLQHQLRQVRQIHQRDMAAGWGRVQLPHSLARKDPNATREWTWQWVFPQHHR